MGFTETTFISLTPIHFTEEHLNREIFPQFVNSFKSIIKMSINQLFSID